MVSKNKFLASVIVFILITLLILMGPAQAMILDLVISDTEPEKGKIVNFIVSAEVETGEQADIDYFSLQILGKGTGKNDIVCDFYPNGTMIDDKNCKGMTIQRLSVPPYGYGYGYSYGYFIKGLFKFNITLDTQIYPIGKYETKLALFFNNSSLEFQGDDFTITTKKMKECSVRGENGVIEFDGVTYTRNKISFYVPLGTASKGNGYLNGQDGRERVSYKFTPIRLIEDNDERMTILVSGTIKSKDIKNLQSEAIITMNKLTGKITITSTEFSASDIDVTFMKGC